MSQPNLSLSNPSSNLTNNTDGKQALEVYVSSSMDRETQQSLTTLMAKLPDGLIRQTPSPSTTPIVALVDGRGLACPLPLLKTKVALRQVAVGEALYVVATDPNSSTDIAAFCQQTANKHTQVSHTSSTEVLQLLLSYFNDSTTDACFHFIITKTITKIENN